MRKVTVSVLEELGRHHDRPVRRDRLGGQPVAVKRYLAADGARIFAEHAALWRSPLGAVRTPPGLARPLEWRPGPRELVSEWVDGAALGQRGDLGRTEQCVDESARLLADLHASGVVPRRRRGAVRLARSLKRKHAELARAPVGAPFGEVVALLEAAAPDVAIRESSVVTHGDWSPRNVLVSPTGLRMIDFDRLQLAGVARDVEYWGAWGWATLLLAGYAPRWDLAERYRAAYLEYRPHVGAELAATGSFHRAAALLRIAHGWSALRGAPDVQARVVAAARAAASACG